MNVRLINEDGLHERGISYSRQHRHRLTKAGKFPKPVKGAGNCNAYVESEIDQYLKDRIAERDAQQNA